MKYAAIIIIGLAVLLTTLLLVSSQKPTGVTPVQPTASAAPTATSPGSAGINGTITGKLCYPSEFLPAGAIEAKNITSNAIVSEEYFGTGGGEGATYSIGVLTGTYILRYKAMPDPNGEPLYGYHTTTCPTGLETTCAAENARERIEVAVMAGETVENIDLCDFYYNSSNPPEF